MNIDNQISILCGGESYIDIDDLFFFQGNLKSIDEGKFYDLKESLKKDGLPLGFHIWINSKNKNDIIDGHHRWLALKELRKEGWFIPPVPCNKIRAKSRKEAAKIVLISNSKYAKMTDESLSNFMIDFELSLEDLNLLDFPDVNLKSLSMDIDDDDIIDMSTHQNMDNFNFTIQCSNLEDLQFLKDKFSTSKTRVKIEEIKSFLK